MKTEAAESNKAASRFACRRTPKRRYAAHKDSLYLQGRANRPGEPFALCKDGGHGVTALPAAALPAGLPRRSAKVRTARQGRLALPDKNGFTLIELVAVIGILAVLIAMLLPMLAQSREAGKSAVCQSNLRQMQLAYTAYLMDHKGKFFPFKESTPQGTLYYFGLEGGGGGVEGSREIDRSHAKLAAYFEQSEGISICPSLKYRSRHFKQKFSMATYGYGLNIYLLAGTPQYKKLGVSSFEQIESPSETITWADCAQINTWQPPASANNPMLEEWYWLAPCIPGAPTPPPFHFRHGGKLNAAFADGSVRTFLPDKTDPRCDGLTGYIEPCGENNYLRPSKTR